MVKCLWFPTQHQCQTWEGCYYQLLFFDGLTVADWPTDWPTDPKFKLSATEEMRITAQFLWCSARYSKKVNKGACISCLLLRRHWSINTIAVCTRHSWLLEITFFTLFDAIHSFRACPLFVPASKFKLQTIWDFFLKIKIQKDGGNDRCSRPINCTWSKIWNQWWIFCERLPVPCGLWPVAPSTAMQATWKRTRQDNAHRLD